MSPQLKGSGVTHRCRSDGAKSCGLSRRPLQNIQSAPVIWSISIWCCSHPVAVRLGCRAGSWLEAEVSIKGFLLCVMRGWVGWEQWKNISSIYKGPFNRRGSSVSLAGTRAVRQPVLPPPPPLSITRAASPGLLHLTRRDKSFSLSALFNLYSSCQKKKSYMLPADKW